MNEITMNTNAIAGIAVMVIECPDGYLLTPSRERYRTAGRHAYEARRLARITGGELLNNQTILVEKK